MNETAAASWEEFPLWLQRNASDFARGLACTFQNSYFAVRRMQVGSWQRLWRDLIQTPFVRKITTPPLTRPSIRLRRTPVKAGRFPSRQSSTSGLTINACSAPARFRHSSTLSICVITDSHHHYSTGLNRHTLRLTSRLALPHHEQRESQSLPILNMLAERRDRLHALLLFRLLVRTFVLTVATFCSKANTRCARCLPTISGPMQIMSPPSRR